MDERPHDPPHVRRVWPPERAAEESLPPSARWYGTPAAPAKRRVPRWAVRAAVAGLSLTVGASLIAGAVVVVLRIVTPEVPAERIVDSLAGVNYTLPTGWQEGDTPPVTDFTSVASDGGQSLVMVRPGPERGARSLREITLDLADLYSRLLLHGDQVDVVDDAPAAVGGLPAHRRSLRAQYRDVVNRPAYLLVVVLQKEAETVVVVALAQPDDPAARAGIEAVVRGMRA